MIFPVLYLSNKRKEKKRKRNINNDLAILPSHDTHIEKSRKISITKEQD